MIAGTKARYGHKAKRGKRKRRHHWIGESGRQTREEMTQARGGTKSGRALSAQRKGVTDDLIPAEKVGSDRNRVEMQRAGSWAPSSQVLYAPTLALTHSSAVAAFGYLSQRNVTR